MPGLVRASLVIKLLFPGVSAPGWLIVMAAPLYALLAYVILIVPYQFTGSGWFIAGVLGVMIGQGLLARAGFALAKPMDDEEAMRAIKKVRKMYVTVMITSGVLIIVALGSLVAKLNLRATDVILAVMKFETNVLILTMIGSDLVVTNLDRARSATQGRDHVEDATETKIAAFVSFEAPPPPPPAAPAPAPASAAAIGPATSNPNPGMASVVPAAAIAAATAPTVPPIAPPTPAPLAALLPSSVSVPSTAKCRFLVSSDMMRSMSVGL
jgi:hypothetical protein